MVIVDKLLCTRSRLSFSFSQVLPVNDFKATFVPPCERLWKVHIYWFFRSYLLCSSWTLPSCPCRIWCIDSCPPEFRQRLYRVWLISEMTGTQRGMHGPVMLWAKMRLNWELRSLFHRLSRPTYYLDHSVWKSTKAGDVGWCRP